MESIESIESQQAHDFKDKRGNLHNIELFESLAFCHS